MSRARSDASFALRRAAVALLLGVTIASAIAVALGLRLSPDVSALLPSRGDAAALRTYTRSFGGSDLAIVLVTSADEAVSERAANAVAARLRATKVVKRAATSIEAGALPDPMTSFRWADRAAIARVDAALTPEGMRARLAETRALLLAPGGGALAEMIARDPLRLAQLVLERASLGGGMRARADGAFASEDGTARLVLIEPSGQALRGAEAKAFVAEVDRVLAEVTREEPEAKAALTGGHAIAAATERMLVRDLTRSSALSTILAGLAFVLLFRRTRALVAVMPPLALGTLWTAAIAAALPGGLSAIAVAFTSVVVGVGVDTGVHVYAALLDARRAGLSPSDAAIEARRRTGRAVLTAAVTAGAAFGALALSDIEAIRQLGLLCAAGEVLTAIAIVAITPEIGARLERGAPPDPLDATWTRPVAWLTATKPRALVVIAVAIAPIPLLAVLGGPSLADALVALRPKKLAPLAVQEQIFERFGGKHGQHVVLVTGDDREETRARADRITEKLASMKDDVASLDTLTAIAPADETQRARLDARDALLRDRDAAAELGRALDQMGFAKERFLPAIEAMKQPPRDRIDLDAVLRGPASILARRYLGRDPERPSATTLAIYLRPSSAEGAADRIDAAIKAVDKTAALTGYGRLDASLRASLKRDLPKIGALAAALVAVALAASLRRARDVALAAAVVAAEVAAVLLLVKLLRVPLHAYDALVIPVLLGITVDEGMFLLHDARDRASIEDTIRHEGPPVAATALTTAAGFIALAICDFDGLRDLGYVGALGSVIGLAVALGIVPAGLRLFARPRSGSPSSVTEKRFGG